jgi:hypothetical protein
MTKTRLKSKEMQEIYRPPQLKVESAEERISLTLSPITTEHGTRISLPYDESTAYGLATRRGVKRTGWGKDKKSDKLNVQPQGV